MTSPRLAVRALIMQENRLLLVNAFPGDTDDLWCAPGGGVEKNASLPDNLVREVWEETGLKIEVGAPCLVNEFHNPADRFHQIDLYFRCTIMEGVLNENWKDPEGIVTRRRFFRREDMPAIRYKPDSLPEVAWGTSGISYDPLELLIKPRQAPKAGA